MMYVAGDNSNKLKRGAAGYMHTREKKTTARKIKYWNGNCHEAVESQDTNGQNTK